MPEKDYLAEYYEAYNEDDRLLRKHGLVEYRTTMAYIEKALFPGAKILEIGAGTGRYSHALARRGYKVQAVELVAHNIDIFRANTTPGEDIQIAQGNALDLSMLENGAYDITLLLGPMYHLYTPQDKRRALSEALRVTCVGGTLMTAYCIQEMTIYEWGFMSGHLQEGIDAGLIDPVTFRARSSPKEVFELCRREDIDALMAGFPVERLHYVATDLIVRLLRETITEMDEETFEWFMRYHLAVCERPDLTGMTNHALDIWRKAG